MITKIKRAIMHPSHLALFLLNKTARFWSDRLFLKLKFRLVMGQKLDLKNPKTFTEKLQWLKLYNRKPEYTTMVDKYAVKAYVENKIGGEYIIPTLGVWNRVEDINWDALPNQFVLKTTHGGGSGGVVICKDKKVINRQEACQQLQRSLNSDIYLNYREWPYKDVPKRIIAEKYMADSQKVDGDLTDYKFYCFNGEPIYCQIIRDRRTKETIDFYDMEWNHMPFVGLNPVVSNGLTPVAKPKNLDVMTGICHRLSENIPFARIDLYAIENEVYFGEITFFPASGIGTFSPIEWNYNLGTLIKLP